MRLLEFIIKLIAVCLPLVLLFRIPIFAQWVSETDEIALAILVVGLLLSLALVGTAIYSRRSLARYAVFVIVGGFFSLLAVAVFLYPTYYAWNKYGFWGAAGAFFLPVLSHAWAFWMNIRQGMWGYGIVFGIMIVYRFIFDWCKFGLKRNEKQLPNHGTEPIR